MNRPLTCLGLMSGTSLDGVDAALITTDGQSVIAWGESLTRPYPDDLRALLRSVLGGVGPVEEAEAAMTRFHADVVKALLAKAALTADQVDVVGFHGHTILHQPDQGRTWQIGDGALLAALTGIVVVNDFRSADVAAGGQGAPLVPIFHAALAVDLPRPVALLNLGGVGNVTWIGHGDEVLAFDTGPGNALIDDWALLHTGQAVDWDGALALAGQVAIDRVTAFLEHPYFAKKPPKSLDRDDFAALGGTLSHDLSVEDGAATLTAFTVQSVAASLRHLPEPPLHWLVCGGGRRNPAIMAGLADALGGLVSSVDGQGWDGDALEAQAFAFLAARSLYDLPLSFPGTTGVSAPQTGGRRHAPR